MPCLSSLFSSVPLLGNERVGAPAESLLAISALRSTPTCGSTFMLNLGHPVVLSENVALLHRWVRVPFSLEALGAALAIMSHSGPGTIPFI
jgi:hypothetical protein